MKNILAFIMLSLLLIINNMGQDRPFPQNIDFPYGYQSTIFSTTTMLDAYDRWKNSFLKNCRGMYRVSGDDTTITISEGMGYGMLLTAYYGEKEYFDGLFEFYKSKRTNNAYNLMGWRVTCDGILDPGSATDGDIDVAYALIVAHYQWGENYLDEARSILSILKEHYFISCGDGYYTMKPGGQFGGCGLTDISYYSPGYFRVFGEVTGDSFWETVAEDAYVLLENAANDSTGLVPDWQTYDGIPQGGPNGGNNYYRYDACRTPWRFSLDYLWNGNSTAQEWCTRITNFAASIGASGIVDGYNLDGTPRGQFNNSPFVGGFAVGSMCNSQEIVNEFAQRLLQLNSAGYDNQYFNLSLRNIYMLVLNGNFWKPGTTTSVEESETSPVGFFLYQSYPNPFNPTTTIRYTIGKTSQARLSIYNLLGQKIKMLVDSFQKAGDHSIVWDATDDYNIPVNSGIYFYRLQTNNISLQNKMILLR
jgi:endo-1,4-beta-D-glucanase Y